MANNQYKLIGTNETYTNINNDDKHNLKIEGCTNDFEVLEKQKCGDSGLIQIVPTPSELNAEKAYELDDSNKVREKNIDRNEMKYSGFESDSESDNELKNHHPNRRLQAERIGSVIKREHPSRLQDEMHVSILKREHPNRHRDEMHVSILKREHPYRHQDEVHMSVLKREHSNRLRDEKTSVRDSKSGNEERGKLRTCHLSSLERRQKRKRCESYHDCEDNNFGEGSQSSLLPRVKRGKWSDERNVTVTSASKTKQENSINEGKNKTAEFWTDVISNPEPWNRDCNNVNIGYSHNVKLEMNYHELLNRYITCDSVRKLKDESWESRFLDKLSDRNEMNFLWEFYIPPAQVELFHLELTDDMSCMECLRVVCETRQWPLPVYKQVPQTDSAAGFVYSCELKTVQFTPTKPASNHVLAQELAAQMCLDRLGLRRRRACTQIEAKYSIDTSNCQRWLLRLIDEFDDYGK